MLTKEDVATPTIVDGWLRDLSLTPALRPDPMNNWNLEFTVSGPPTLIMNVANSKTLPRAIMLMCGLSPMAVHATAFQGFNAAQRSAFWKDLRALLSRDAIDFQIEGVVTECPKAVRISAMRFDDGLSLDAFARTLSAVCKACFDLVFFFTDRLGDPIAAEAALKKTAAQ